GTDETNRDYLFELAETKPKQCASMMQDDYWRRLFDFFVCGSGTVWPGTTWILGLLPARPRYALQAIHTYLSANIMYLPDWRIHGLGDAEAVIRARYIGIPSNYQEYINSLLDLGWRDFEILIANLYNRMGYKVKLTPSRRDGGRDIEAISDRIGEKQNVCVE